MEEKRSKGGLEAAGKGGLATAGPGLLPRKPPGLAAGPAGTYGKAVSLPLSPRASPVAALKAKVIQKLEDASKPPAYAYPAIPRSHSTSPPLASPPPTPVSPARRRPPRMWSRRKTWSWRRKPPAPSRPCSQISRPGTCSKPCRRSTEGPTLSCCSPRRLLMRMAWPQMCHSQLMGPSAWHSRQKTSPIRLSPSKIPESLREGPEEEPLAQREVKAEVEDMDEGPAELPPLESPLPLPTTEAMATPSPAGSCGGGLLEAQALSATRQGCMEPSKCPDFAEGPEAQVDSPGWTEPCTAALDLGVQRTPETLVETKEEPVEVPVAVPVAEAVPEEDLTQATPSEPQPSLQMDCDVPAGEGQCPSLEPQEAVPVPSSTCYLEEGSSDQFLPCLEDPLAGMNTLAAAAELPQARPLRSPGAAGAQAVETMEAAKSLVLEQSFLHGITLLSEIAELELERRSQEQGGVERALVVRPSLESLLAARSHMLREVLDGLVVDPLKNLRLPRELKPNKKYSWMCKKEEQMYAMKSSLEDMDAASRDDYELGAGIRKSHKGPEEEHDALIGMGKARGRSQTWDEDETSSDFISQLKIKKKKMASYQEQLASKLGKALSLTKQDKLKSLFKYLTPYDSLLGKERKALAKGLGLSLKSSREGKHKGPQAGKMEVGFKGRGQPKSAHSPFASEVSSYSYNTDSDEDEEFPKDQWPAQGPSSSKLTPSFLCGMVAKNSKAAGGPKLTRRGLVAPQTLKPKPATSWKQPFCFLLREAEARSSFRDSSEESHDQGY
ncbi:Trinucleotide repeat-containing protein 18 protein [Saguinus oedipus]|uniref:Trinucleotide repeat-containing protein 18 protein n=1 Tax=Saguinus oedipus TaxID=9490 RepID=A0ABQ9WCV5_SAGOE|nr:Trinucleotide repeat-containing protein 18 protein [Saguinus oedipus]